MQSFTDRERSRSMEKSRLIAPYSKRGSPSPVSAGRNFDFRRGRIHDPNESDGSSSSVKNRKNGKTISENDFYFPTKVLYRWGESEINRKFRENNIGNESTALKMARFSDLAPNEYRENPFEQISEVFQPRFPIQMIGKLSLAEPNGIGLRMPWGDVEGNGKCRTRDMKGKATAESPDVKSRSPNDDYHFERKEYQSRLLSGTVDKVLQWFELKNNVNLLFEVTAPLVDIKSGKFPGEKCLVVRDEKTGPSLLVTFYEIDRKLPELVIGSMVRCIGRLTNRNFLHAFRVDQSSEEEKALSQRLFFISNLVAQQAKAIYTKK